MIRHDYALPEATQHAPATRKSTNASYAPLTHRQAAVLLILCVLGVLLTAAVGFRLLVWGLG